MRYFYAQQVVANDYLTFAEEYREQLYANIPTDNAYLEKMYAR